MGRHADPDPRHFWRSLAAAGLRAALALALVVGLFAALSTLGRVPEDGPVILGGPEDGNGERSPAPRDPTPSPSPDTAASPGADPDGPSPGAVADEEPPAASGDDPTEALLAAAPPPQETTVQVLDGVGSPPRVAALAAALRELGYDVVAINPAGVDYPTTTVLFTAGNEPAAVALQARDPRIVDRRPNEAMAEHVHLHVVLGADWQP